MTATATKKLMDDAEFLRDLAEELRQNWQKCEYEVERIRAIADKLPTEGA